MYSVLDCCRQQDTVKHPGSPHRLATMAGLESGSWLWFFQIRLPHSVSRFLQAFMLAACLQTRHCFRAEK